MLTQAARRKWTTTFPATCSSSRPRATATSSIRHATSCPSCAPHRLVLLRGTDTRPLQRYDVRPHELCERLGFPPPVSVSAKDGSYVDAYMLMTQTALQMYAPRLSLPPLQSGLLTLAPRSKRAKDRKDSGSGSSLWTYALLGALLAATAYTGYRLIKSKQRPVGPLTQ